MNEEWEWRVANKYGEGWEDCPSREDAEDRAARMSTRWPTLAPFRVQRRAMVAWEDVE